ncbi:MAG TPA: class I SAM-dependent methyltransferase [Bryobacteraceae bacterium]|nr:class I SAM-dependent methyltransferase [Bryobacteraceae bacterium]
MMEALQRYGPNQPIPVLITELNKLYHEWEAERYEHSHPEIFEQLPPIWDEMLAVLDARCPQESFRILDFGCGTGFEARQFLGHFEPRRVEKIVCYDPSPGMLMECQRSLGTWRDKTEFVADLRDVWQGRGEFNVLVTNSVLHHLPQPVQAIRHIADLLAPRSMWLCGHEPSNRFVKNPECRAVLRQYHASDRWRRLFSARRCARRVLRWTGAQELPEDYAARRAYEQSMFQLRPPAQVVSRLVDFHVVSGEADLAESSGLDFLQLQTALAGEWNLLWRRTYSFLGSHYERTLPTRWQREAHRLAANYPDDGANFCLIWQRGKLP